MKPKKISRAFSKNIGLPKNIKSLEFENTKSTPKISGVLGTSKLLAFCVKRKYNLPDNMVVKGSCILPYPISLLSKLNKTTKVLKKGETIVHNNLSCSIINFKNKKISYINNLSSLGSFKGFKVFYNKMMTKIKENKSTHVYCHTWIFYEHPNLAEKLGFKLVRNIDKFKSLLEKNKIIKIEKYSFKSDKLICRDIDNKIVALNANLLPLWVKEIK
jgi:hypothetical protein